MFETFSSRLLLDDEPDAGSDAVSAEMSLCSSDPVSAAMSRGVTPSMSVSSDVSGSTQTH